MMRSFCLIALFVAGGNCGVPAITQTSGDLQPGKTLVLGTQHTDTTGTLTIKYDDIILATNEHDSDTVTPKDTLGGRIDVTVSSKAIAISMKLLPVDNGVKISVVGSETKEYPITLEKYISAIAKTGNTTANGTAIFTCTHSLAADAKIDVYFESTRVNTVTVTSSGGTFESHNNLTSRATVEAPSGTSVKLTIANLADADNGKVVSCRNEDQFLDIAAYRIDFDCPETTTTSGALSNAKTNMMVLAVLATFSSFLF